MDQISSLPTCIQKEVAQGIRNGIFLGVKGIKKKDKVEAIILAKVDQNAKAKGQFFYAIGENVDVCDKKIKDLSSCIEIVEEKLTLLNEEKKHTNKCIRKLFRP